MTTDQPETNQDFPYDTALGEHLVELKEICRETCAEPWRSIGAGGMWVMRHTAHIWISFEIDGEVKELRLPKSGTLFICRFTSTDGGDPGLE